MPHVSVPLYFVNAVLRHTDCQGLDTEQLLRRARISPRLLQESEARVSAEQYARLQTHVMREMDDEMLGYCARPSRIGQWSALCHWLIHCRNLRQVLKRCSLFFRILENNFQPELLVSSETFSILIKPPPANTTQLEPFAYELFTFSLHRQLRWLTKNNLPLEYITLPYPVPEHAREYRPLFEGAPTIFDAPSCMLVFKRKLLETQVRQNPEDLADFLRRPLYNTLVNTHQGISWSQRIKNVIGEDLTQLPTFAEIADTLTLSPKRLRRMLNDEGLTYSDLKLQLRRDIAIQHLANASSSIEDIAYKTGFSEASSFIRAFKGWTGVTPLTYRKDLT